MDSLNLEPRYSTDQLPGKCIKCLAEKELNDCLRELLKDDENDKELEEKYELMVDFLQSPESKKLRDQSEKYLSEGKKVTLKISITGGKPEYILEVNE